MNLQEEFQVININQLDAFEKIELTKETYLNSSYFQEIFHADHLELGTAQESQMLRDAIASLLTNKNLLPKGMNLEDIHHHLNDEMRAYNFNDGVNKISTTLYEPDAAIEAAYQQLIKKLRSEFLNEPFYFQATPTIRVHCPNSANSHHYPRYHSDISYGHPPEEINIWIPLTHKFDGHGFKIIDIKKSTSLLEKYNFNFTSFIEDAINNPELTTLCEQYAFDVTTSFGNLFAFDSRCIHSGEPLKTHTRVSLDIRILPLSRFKNMRVEYQGSGRRKILFTPGNCYHQLNSDDFLNQKGINQ
jgi:hypothetical protein